MYAHYLFVLIGLLFLSQSKSTERGAIRRGAAVSNNRADKNDNELYYEPDGYVLPSTEDMLTLAARHEEEDGRELTHTIPPLATPKGCKYTYNHMSSNKTYVDLITCPAGCGKGYDASLVATSICSDGTAMTGKNCNTTLDCRVVGCTDTKCTAGPGGCPCPALTSTALPYLCAQICPGYPFPVAKPTPKATSPPTSKPTVKGGPKATTIKPTLKGS